METSPAYIKKIEQTTNSHFTIDWTDGKKQQFSLQQLQENCPCATCKNKTQSDSNESKKLGATSIENVGRYAIRVQFINGCSNGIFDFSYLRSLGA